MALAPGSDNFFKMIRPVLFHNDISQDQVDGINVILAAWDKYLDSPAAPKYNPCWIACTLANAYHETGAQMQPVSEIGYGRGHAYGHPVGPWHEVYYGRGLIQETWLKNYQFANDKLHAAKLLADDQDLVKTPDLMLRPDVSAATLVMGMTEGWFTGEKLIDFDVTYRSTLIYLGGFDWVNSRRIVNGLDRAAIISTYGRDFYRALIAKE